MSKRPSKKPSPRAPQLPPASYRHQAEKLSRTGHPRRAASSDVDQTTLYELEVHQIELGLQNQDLCATQADLTEARDKFLDLYDFAPLGYLALDAHRVVRQANLTAATLLGVERAKLIGMRMERFVEKESRDEFYLHLQSVRSAKGPCACDLAMRRGDGSAFFARLNSMTLIHEGQAYRIALADISALHDAEESLRQSERRFRALIEKSADYIALADVQGTLIYESPSAFRSTGFSPGELVGHSILDRVHPDDRPSVARLFEIVASRAGNSVTAELRVQARDGSWRWMQAVGTNLLDDPAVGGIVLNAHDVTEHKRALEELQAMNARLDERVRERTVAIQVLHDIASVANRAQDVKQALEQGLTRLTAYNGWLFGHALLPAADDADALRAVCFCYPKGAERFAAFREATAGMVFRGCDGMIGRVLAGGKPVWSTQPKRDLCTPRGDMAAELGLRTAGAFPVLVGEKVVGVLEFFSEQLLRSDEETAEVMAGAGLQLGRVVERANFEQRLLAIADELQQRLAQDLHDDLGQELTGLGLQVETLAECLAGADPQMLTRAAGVVAAVDRARQKAHNLVRRTLPIELELGSLSGALRKLAAAMLDSHLTCSFRDDHPETVFDSRVAAQLYRIAQESLSNAIRHSQAGNIGIVLSQLGGRTTLEITDDGQGMPAGAPSGEGLGLRIMRNRAALIGATLEIVPGEAPARVPRHGRPL